MIQTQKFIPSLVLIPENCNSYIPKDSQILKVLYAVLKYLMFGLELHWPNMQQWTNSLNKARIMQNKMFRSQVFEWV